MTGCPASGAVQATLRTRWVTRHTLHTGVGSNNNIRVFVIVCAIHFSLSVPYICHCLCYTFGCCGPSQANYSAKTFMHEF